MKGDIELLEFFCCHPEVTQGLFVWGLRKMDASFVDLAHIVHC